MFVECKNWPVVNSKAFFSLNMPHAGKGPGLVGD